MQPASVLAAATILWWRLLILILAPTMVSCNACPPSTFDHVVNSDGALEFPLFHRDHLCAQQHLALARSSQNLSSLPIDLRHEELINNFIFLMPVKLGTPPVWNLVAVDTGATLSFVQCQPCTLQCHRQSDAGAIFDPSKSDTLKNVGCSEGSCVTVQHTLGLPTKACMEIQDICLYSMTFGSASAYSVGKLVRDRLQIGESKGYSFSDFLFGCSLDTEYYQYEAGIFGFGAEPFSFFEQVWGQVGYKAFSYCFPISPKKTGYLSIGNYNRANSSFYTPLFYTKQSSHYALTLDKLVVNGVPLATNPSEMIVDSGARWTLIQSDIFDQLDTVITQALKPLQYNRSYIRGEEYMCFEDAFFVTFKKWSALPVIVLSFDKGASLTLPPESSFYFDPNWGLCTHFRRITSANGAQLLGNMMTRSTGITYDIEHKQFAFRNSDC